MEYAQLEPFGSDVEDLRSGSLMWLISSALGAKNTTPETFMVNRHLSNATAPPEAEPAEAEDAPVSKETIAELARLLGAPPPPWSGPRSE